MKRDFSNFKSFEQRVIDRLLTRGDYMSEFMDTLRARANNPLIDLNHTFDRLHDRATLDETKEWVHASTEEEESA